jgi:two-component system response regulator
MAAIPRILIVDDNQLDAQLLREAFGEAGFAPAVVWAPSGSLGIEFLKRMPLDEPLLVVLDLNMPGVSGHEILREMRDSERFREVPVLVFTTSTLAADRDACGALGISGFLRKPSTFEEYRGVVEAIRGLVEAEKIPAPAFDEG